MQDILNNKVIVFPDFILYEDIYSTESRLTFSRSCIRVEGSTVNGAKQTFNVEWAVSDIISIESEWWGRVSSLAFTVFLLIFVSLISQITGCRLRLLWLISFLSQRFLKQVEMLMNHQVCAFLLTNIVGATRYMLSS